MKVKPSAVPLGYIKDALALAGALAAFLIFHFDIISPPTWFVTYMLLLVIIFDGVFTLFPMLRVMKPFETTPGRMFMLMLAHFVGILIPLLIIAALSGDFMGFFSYREDGNGKKKRE